MASSRQRRHGAALLFGSTGWLFADLMLALVAAFLIANTVGQPKAVPRCPGSGTAVTAVPFAAGVTPSQARVTPRQAAAAPRPAAIAALRPGSPCVMTVPTPARTTAAPTTPPRQLVLNPNPFDFTIRVDYQGILTNDPSVVASALSQVQQNAPGLFDGRQRAGVVLAFGGTPVAQRSLGKPFASAFFDNVLRPAGPGFASAAPRPYWTEADLGTIELTIFFFG
jgi:hypothetical protein